MLKFISSRTGLYKLITCLILVTSNGVSNASDDQLLLKINNISDYFLSFTVIAIDSNGHRIPEIDAHRGDLQVGEVLELKGIPTDIHLDIHLGTESDSVEKSANTKYGIQAFTDISKGMVYSIAGYHNYALNANYPYTAQSVCKAGEKVSKTWSEWLSVKSESAKKIVFLGDKNIRKNQNPLDGTLDLIEGISGIMSGVVAVSNTIRNSSINYILKPSELNTDTKGVRLLISNSKSWVKSGISLDVEEFGVQRRGMFRINRTIPELKVED